jgi:hypothetical protein
MIARDVAALEQFQRESVTAAASEDLVGRRSLQVAIDAIDAS